ncbi:MAG: hypothetical protein NTZ22_02970, partial [Hyphomicrobiales bacterium]|nr:hypothetical protein [Hyphomicrobiales bacterium]
INRNLSAHVSRKTAIQYFNRNTAAMHNRLFSSGAKQPIVALQKTKRVSGETSWGKRHSIRRAGSHGKPTAS